MKGFRTAWDAAHPGCNPVGYMMRAAGAPNWVRFHSLPGSKRYAETDEERQTLLARQNQLAGEVLGEGGAAWLVQTCWPMPWPEGEDALFQAIREHGLTFAFEFQDADDAPDERRPWRAHAALVRWKSHAVDDLLWSIAEDRAGRTLWMSEQTGAVFAPYDGGVDLFLPSADAVSAMKSDHRSWLSTRPDGL